MKEDQHLFDTSDYPKDHFLYSNENKKVISKFKDENAGSPVMEFVGLRSKMYAMQTWYERDAKSKEKKTAKGVRKSVMEKELTHELYRECLFTKTSQTHAMMGFRTEKHEMYTEKLNKTTLSPYDDNRLLLGGWNRYTRLWTLLECIRMIETQLVIDFAFNYIC